MSKARPRKCHYGGEDFAAIILDSKPNDVFSVEPKTAKALIEPYIWEDADDDMAHRAIKCSIEKLYGKEDEHFRKLPYLADELEKLDYDVDLYTTDAVGMNMRRTRRRRGSGSTRGRASLRFRSRRRTTRTSRTRRS